MGVSSVLEWLDDLIGRLGVNSRCSELYTLEKGYSRAHNRPLIAVNICFSPLNAIFVDFKLRLCRPSFSRYISSMSGTSPTWRRRSRGPSRLTAPLSSCSEEYIEKYPESGLVDADDEDDVGLWWL
jgi:hypothetical protein